MNLAYKKILGKFTKVLGFGKTTPPHVGKNSQMISFFFWESVPNYCDYFLSTIGNLHCCGEPTSPGWGGVFLADNCLQTIYVIFMHSITTYQEQLLLFFFLSPFSVQSQNLPWPFWFWLPGCKRKNSITNLQCRHSLCPTSLWVLYLLTSCILQHAYIWYIRQCWPVYIRLSGDPELHLAIFPFHNAAHTHVRNLQFS